MVVRSIEYTNFRNIEKQKIIPSENVTLLYGKNAEGKTNALEGFYLFAYGRSHRATKEREMISFGEDISRLKLLYSDKKRENSREIAISSAGKKLLRHNGIPVSRLSEFTGGFRAVLFAPQHLSIVKNGPADRREFLDLAITQLDRKYVSALQRYRQILIERNNLIKGYYENRSSFDSTIDVWSAELAKAGEYISKARFEYVGELEGYVKDIFRDMTDSRENIVLAYSEPKTEEEYYRLLCENHEREIKAGMTLFGPHRDDISIELNGHQARLFCSQGQMRSISLAMKLAEGEISREKTGEYPVFLLDDVLSELDEERRDYILRGMKNRQIVLTACDRMNGADAYYRVEKGRYIPG